uniref:Parkin coregulated gene protein homolog n=2 Tax=Cacopsylla melanoneura TaxID=428564 RepID=A0A8D8Z9U1_9HEMI
MVQSSEYKQCKNGVIVCRRARELQYDRRPPLPVRVVPAFSQQSLQKDTYTGFPPKSLANDKKYDFTFSFRTYYSRGDFPIAMEFRSVGNKISWKEDIKTLNYHYYLPIFFDGLRETEYPYKFFASKGIHDLLENGKDKIVPVLPHLILPIKNALSTGIPEVICETLKVIQHLVQSSPLVGEALVPFYKQILPHLNMYKNLNKNIGDSIDYSQMKRANIGDLVQETLQVLERYGGEDACIYIKYMIPTYESCILRYTVN